MATCDEVLGFLRAAANPASQAEMARVGIVGAHRLGVPVPEMRRIAKANGRDHALALALWKTGIADARIVASMIADPAKLTERDMDAWARDFDSWDVVDQVCSNLFDKTPFSRRKILEWAQRDEEYVKRAAFVLIACLAWHDKKAPDAEFIAWLPLIAGAATDERNFVRKAVNWALRNIGKRNAALNQAAVQTAEEIQGQDSKAARWIASDALRELGSDAVRKRLAK
jgi:3-methyladenine DNA glycosylase AlkD